MSLLAGRNGLVFGVANARSIAWGITRRAVDQGARVGLTYLDARLARRVEPLAEQIDAPFCVPCDVSDDAQLDACFAAAAEAFDGKLDFVVHSVAFARREDLGGAFAETSREGFALAMDISAYSLLAMARRARPLMVDGGALLALSYIGAERVIANYHVMGPAKAALEANIRYLAADLGPAGIRVNGISAGPIKTLAAAGIPGFRAMLKANAEAVPLRRNVTADEVGDAAVFLLSDMARSITGEVLHVDSGFHVMGVPSQ